MKTYRIIYPTLGGARKIHDFNFKSAINLWFDDKTKAIEIYGKIENWDTKDVYDMSEAFWGRENFNENISKWDTSNVEDMNGMFYGAKQFNQPIGEWNTSKVENMEYMFEDAKEFNQPIGKWDTSKVKNMRSMFKNAENFNGDITNWNTSNVTNMSDMFHGASSFNQDIYTKTITIKKYIFIGENITYWDTSKVKSMDSMFQRAEKFNGKIDNWDVSNVIDMEYMFADAKSFNQNINTKEITKEDGTTYIAWNVSNVKRMNYMFRDAKSFSPDSLNLWDTSNVVSMSHMFDGAEKFNGKIDRWATSNVFSPYSMFKDTTSFNKKNIDSKIIISVLKLLNTKDSPYIIQKAYVAWDLSSINYENLFDKVKLSGLPKNWVKKTYPEKNEEKILIENRDNLNNVLFNLKKLYQQNLKSKKDIKNLHNKINDKLLNKKFVYSNRYRWKDETKPYTFLNELMSDNVIYFENFNKLSETIKDLNLEKYNFGDFEFISIDENGNDILNEGKTVRQMYDEVIKIN